ncbi:MAG: rhomboid family intramembrane serine protease, partial [Candidatus Eisenbacteria bacterium]|nr:rhomboid family intramembrane serine protease [Candidatus Eisenbacteria bacterium]
FSTRHILAQREYHRLLSSSLIHADWMHLIFNMFSLYSFGRYVELVFGLQTFLLVYLASILGGSLIALYLHRHEEYYALGASGGVCGVIYSSIFLLPGGSVRLFLFPVPIPSWIYAIAFLLISFYGLHARLGRIGHDAHAGGAIVGLLVTTAIEPSIIGRSPVLYAVIAVISLALFAYVHRRSVQGAGERSE